MTVHRHLVEHDHLEPAAQHTVVYALGGYDRTVTLLPATSIIVDLAGVEPAEVHGERVCLSSLHAYIYVRPAEARAHALRILAACQAIERELSPPTSPESE